MREIDCSPPGAMRQTRLATLLPPEALFGGVGVLILSWVFWPTLAELARRWGADSRYSHGYLVPLFAGYLLWARRGILAAGVSKPSWLGLPVLAVGLAIRLAGTYLYAEWLATIALLPCLAGLVLLARGRRGLLWAWAGLSFLPPLG